jgi:hypothetical protein
MAIEKEATPYDEAVSYRSRVYATFNHSKHTFLCCREQSNKRTVPRRYNNIQYCTQKWMSEISEGNKFSMAIGSGTYTTGFYDSARAGIWKEDELTDPVTGKFIRARLRGVDYEYGFEIVLNKEPALEKSADNIRMITKSLPFEIVYTTSEDENDAAVNIWGSVPDRVLRQK